MKDFRIGKRIISRKTPPLVIAEACINHNGSLAKAIQLVNAAVNAGAECIKFHTHIVDKEMIPTNIRPGNISREKQWDIVKRCQLSEKEEKRLKTYCDSKKIIYLSTPFSREAADRLFKLGVPAFKIGSGECANLPLLEHIAKKRIPIILSTGMHSVSSIKKSVALLRTYSVPFMLMHTVSLYPTPYSKVCLGAIKQLHDQFRVPVGLSDHSLGIYTSLAAVACGAVVLEKHFTVSTSWPGPDNAFSIEPNDLKHLILGSNAVWQAIQGNKTVYADEKPIMDFAFASVVSTKLIAKGERLSSDNIWVKRPGTGDFKASDFYRLCGKKAQRVIAAETQIKKADIAA